jgi:hypothetical protein
LTEFETFIYARIDGQTSCRDIVEAASDSAGVADVIQKLWQSDQIILDRSPKRTTEAVSED